MRETEIDYDDGRKFEVSTVMDYRQREGEREREGQRMRGDLYVTAGLDSNIDEDKSQQKARSRLR